MTSIINDSLTAVKSETLFPIFDDSSSNQSMKTCEEIRRDNLNRLIKEAGGIPSLAERYGCTEPMIKSLQKGYKDSKSGTPKEIGRKVARDLEVIMGKEIGWMDHDHDEFSRGSLSETERLILSALPLFSHDLQESWIETARKTINRVSEKQTLSA